MKLVVVIVVGDIAIAIAIIISRLPATMHFHRNVLAALSAPSRNKLG